MTISGIQNSSPYFSNAADIKNTADVNRNTGSVAGSGPAQLPPVGPSTSQYSNYLSFAPGSNLPPAQFSHAASSAASRFELNSFSSAADIVAVMMKSSWLGRDNAFAMRQRVQEEKRDEAMARVGIMKDTAKEGMSNATTQALCGAASAACTLGAGTVDSSPSAEVPGATAAQSATDTAKSTADIANQTGNTAAQAAGQASNAANAGDKATKLSTAAADSKVATAAGDATKNAADKPGFMSRLIHSTNRAETGVKVADASKDYFGNTYAARKELNNSEVAKREAIGDGLDSRKTELDKVTDSLDDARKQVAKVLEDEGNRRGDTVRMHLA